MSQEVARLIESMDVTGDTKPNTQCMEMARRIAAHGSQVLDILIDIGTKSLSIIEQHSGAGKAPPEWWPNVRKVRAVILTLSEFCKPRFLRKPQIYSRPEAIQLLIRFADSRAGYVGKDAKQVLHQLGISQRHLRRELLISLPLTPKQQYDNRILGIENALDLIERTRLENMFGHVVGNCYKMGSSYTHAHEMFRVGENQFVYRIRRISDG